MVFSKRYLSKVKDGTYRDRYESVGTYWAAFYVNGDNVT